MSFQNLVGQTFGQYELQSLLGAGGMGAVYRASQRSLKRLVAVKVLSAAVAEQPTYLERFNREAEVSASLEHKHIVPVYDYGVQDNTPYIVMRLLTGGSLAQRMQQAVEAGRSLPTLYETSNLLKQLASALDYAHMRGIIHRDIKPGNVMFDNLGDAYLVDFGIAKLLDSMTDLTGTSGLGTPSYMPPEQWMAQELTSTADQYALAIAIYNMLTGHLPFDAETPFQMMHKHLNEHPTPVRSHRHDLSPAVELVLERALNKTPHERFPTVTAFSQAFDAAIEGAPAETTGFFDFRLAGVPADGGGTPLASRSSAPASAGGGTPPPSRVPTTAGASGVPPVAPTGAPSSTVPPVTPPPTSGRPTSATPPPPRRGGFPWLPFIIILVVLLAGIGLIVSQIGQTNNQPTATAIVAAASPTTEIESTEDNTPTRQALIVNTPGPVTETPIPSETSTPVDIATEAETDSITPELEASATPESVSIAALSEPTETEEPTATPTETVEPTATPTETAEPSATPTETVEPSATPTETVEPSATPTETAEPSATPTETVEPSAIPTETVEPSPTVPDTATPPPPAPTKRGAIDTTNEPQSTESAPQEGEPAPRALGEGVTITYEDNFDGPLISQDWDVWNTQPSIIDGVLWFVGQNTWDNAIARQGIDRNEGILLLFRYDQDDLRMEFNLQSGDYSDDSWRNWTFASWNVWDASAYYGPEATNFVHYETPYLEPARWYYLFFRIGDDGTFYTQVWERDNPAYFLVNVAEQPPGGGWDRDDWEFVVHPYSSTVRLDSYQELSFPADYVMPETPPNLAGVPVARGPEAAAAALSTQTALESPDVLAFCDDPYGGVEPPTIQAGQMIDVYWYWFATTASLLEDHVNTVSYEVYVDGELLTDWERYREPVYRIQDGNYYQYWSVPFGPMEAGAHEIRINISWSVQISDGYSFYGPGSSTPDWTSTCSFTVE